MCALQAANLTLPNSLIRSGDNCSGAEFVWTCFLSISVLPFASQRDRELMSGKARRKNEKQISTLGSFVMSRESPHQNGSPVRDQGDAKNNPRALTQSMLFEEEAERLRNVVRGAF